MLVATSAAEMTWKVSCMRICKYFDCARSGIRATLRAAISKQHSRTLTHSPFLKPRLRPSATHSGSLHRLLELVFFIAKSPRGKGQRQSVVTLHRFLPNSLNFTISDHAMPCLALWTHSARGSCMLHQPASQMGSRLATLPTSFLDIAISHIEQSTTSQIAIQAERLQPGLKGKLFE